MNKTHQIGQHLIGETIKRARGRDKPYCLGDLPSDKYYVANLSPEYGSADREEFDAKTRPSSISLECQPKQDTTASITIEFESTSRACPRIRSIRPFKNADFVRRRLMPSISTTTLNHVRT